MHCSSLDPFYSHLECIGDSIQVCQLQKVKVFFNFNIFLTGANHNVAVNVVTETSEVVMSQHWLNCGGNNNCKIGEELLDDKGNEVKDKKGKTVFIRNKTQILKVKKSAQTAIMCPEKACKGKHFSWTCPKARKKHYEKEHPGKKKEDGTFDYPKIECDLCKKKFSQIWKHLRDVHKQYETDETCMLCRVSIKGKEKMKEHYAEKHKDNKCEGCLRQFETPNDSQEHQCGDGNGVFVCPACKKEFSEFIKDEKGRKIKNKNGNDPQGHKCAGKK